jgi:hypothetical protein
MSNKFVILRTAVYSFVHVGINAVVATKTTITRG